MADYSQQFAELQAAADICAKPEHQITTPVNGVQTSYPRWPNAFAACEVVWQWYLETKTMARDGSDDEDRDTVMREAARLKRLR